MTVKSFIIGREEESAEIMRIINSAEKGENYFLLISGDTGIGKTSLIEDCLKSSNVKYYMNRSIEEAAPSYSSIKSIIRSYIRGQKVTKINFGRLTKYLSIILPELSAEPVETDKLTLADAVCDALLKISEDKPLIIFLDDIQWADNATIELLPLLTEKLENFPLIFLAAFRNDDKDLKIKWLRNELRRNKKLVEINLQPLSKEKTGYFIQYFSDDIPDESLVNLIFEKTGGNPFFIEEFVSTLRENNLIEKKDYKIVLKNNSTIPLPESIKDTILFKIRNISPEAYELLETAAIAGQEFEPDIFNEINSNNKGLQELFNKNILIDSGSGKAEFKHVLIRDTIKTEIPWNKKREINIKIAGLFEKKNYQPEIIAYHWLEANEFDKARNLLLQSAKQSCDIQAYNDAARTAGKALEIWPEGKEDDKKTETLIQLAHCLQLSGELNSTVKILSDAINISAKKGDYKNLGKAYRFLAAVYGTQGNWELFLKARIDSAVYFEKAGLYEDSAAEYLIAASKSTGLLKFENALSLITKAIELSDLTGNYEIKSRALGLKGNVTSMLGNFSEGKKIVEDALEIALRNNLTEAASEIYRRLASTMEYASDYSSAKEAYYSAYNFCVSVGSDMYAQICLSCMSYVLFQTGEWKKSIEISDDVIRNSKSPDGSKSAALLMKALIHAFRGEIKSAEKNLNKSLQLILKSSNRIMLLFYHWCKAIIAENNNDIIQEISGYRDAINFWRNTRDRHDIIIVLIWAASSFCRENEEKDLINCVEALTQISTETSNPEANSALLFSLGELSAFNNKSEEACIHFEQALEHQKKLNVPLEKMFMQIRFGEILLKLNKKEEAADQLQSAYSIAKNFAIRLYISKIAALLKEAGYTAEKRNRNKIFDRPDSLILTKRQNEILHLLSLGLTNKEIADQLYLSSRTVDMHVSHIFERLNCSTRIEAINKARDMNLV